MKEKPRHLKPVLHCAKPNPCLQSLVYNLTVNFVFNYLDNFNFNFNNKNNKIKIQKI
jgi:hypothetical protein